MAQTSVASTHQINGSHSGDFSGDPLNLSHEVNFYFEKKFKYRRGQSNWNIPSVKRLFKDYYQLDSLQTLKANLNAVKAKLNDYEIEEWSAHTRRRDPTNEIPWRLKNEIKAEFVTVAWCKFYECLNQFPLVRGPKLNSLHLCEAPGAFVAALNHHLYSKYDPNEVHWNWLATSLNPYYEGNPLNKMIVDDRFMLFSLNNWIFHNDFTGNIINKSNINSMAEECQKRLNGEEIHLITADGSVDCTEKPDCQEELVSTLHFSEICAALKILGNGGCFVLKMFTLFEATSMSKVYLLNCLFEEVNVFKPATSKHGNSEVYLVCIGFFKQEVVEFPEILEIMLGKITTDNILPIFQKKDIPDDFCLQHEICCRLFMAYQIKAIDDNIKSFSSKCRIIGRHYHILRSKISEEYFTRYKIQSIPTDKAIMNKHHDIIQHQGVKTRVNKGSYTDRALMKKCSIEEKIFLFAGTLNGLVKSMNCKYGEIANWKCSPDTKVELQISRAAPFESLNSSLFITYHILMLRLNLQEIIAIDPIWYHSPICEINEQIKYAFSPSANDNFSQYQQKFFSKIFQSVIDHEPDYIKFTNYAFLTHFSASLLLYMSSNIFTNFRITFDPDFQILFYDCTYDVLIKNLLREILTIIDKDCDIHCFINITHLHHNEFYNKLTEFNDQLLIRNYKLLLDSLR